MVEKIIPGTKDWQEQSAQHLSRYFFAGGFVQGRHVIDAGCGFGYGTAILSETGVATILGVDIAPEAIAYAQKHFSGSNITFNIDDCEKLATINSPVDVICSFENIEHLKHPERFLARACELLTSKGKLICSSPDRSSMPPFKNGKPINPYHINEWYREEFEALLKKYFKEVDMHVQIVSISLTARRQAVANLRASLNWLISDPFHRLTVAQRRFRGLNMPQLDLEPLVAPDITDYPIYPVKYADIVGRPWCHVAICSKPHRL